MLNHLFLLLLFLSSLCLSSPIPNPQSDPLLSSTTTTPHTVPIVLLHMYDSVSFFHRLGKLTGENKARYAKRHGYHMVTSVPGETTGVLKQTPCSDAKLPQPDGKCWDYDNGFDIDHSRAPTFGKIRLALAACRGRDGGWLLWTDADAMVLNQSVRLETLIDDGYDLMFAYDWLMMNAGMMLIKCSDWAKSFLQAVYDARKFDKARALDQSALQEHLDNLPIAELDQHVKIVPKHAINVYPEEYRPGDFLMHFAGKLYEATEPGLVAIATQFDILSGVDDIEDIRAFFRGRRLLNYYSGTCPVGKGHRQSECKPNDSRRILLNESLGSMSYPNRYRHVGLRYYWLHDWKDKYDVPEWNIKRKALPIPESAPAGREMPPVPVGARHEEVDLPHVVAKGGVVGLGKGGRKEDGGDDSDLHEDDQKQGVPEVDHEAEMGKQVEPEKNVLKGNNGDDRNDDGEGRGSSWGWWIGVWGVGGAITVGGLLILRRRRRKLSKIQ